MTIARRAQALLSVASGEHVSIISAKQLLDWADARAAMQISGTTQTDSTLAFDVTDAAHNATVLVPAVQNGKRIGIVERCDGTRISTTTSTIKGVEQTFIPATNGRTVVVYGDVTYDQSYVCTGVSTSTGSNTTGAGTTGSNTTGTNTTGSNTTSSGGAGVAPTSDGALTRGIRTTATNRRPPFMQEEACGTSLAKPCLVRSSSLGLRSVIRQVPADGVAAATGTARVEVDRRLGREGRWRRVATTNAAIGEDGVLFDWRPRRYAGGLYRMRVTFPAASGGTASRSVASYVRIVTPRFASRTMIRLGTSRTAARCGTNLARPCRLTNGIQTIGGTTLALPRVTRPDGQHATVLVLVRTSDLRWAKAQRLRVRVSKGSASWTIAADDVQRGRIYRVITKFPGAQDVPAGDSASTYFRVDATD